MRIHCLMSVLRQAHSCCLISAWQTFSFQDRSAGYEIFKYGRLASPVAWRAPGPRVYQRIFVYFFPQFPNSQQNGRLSSAP